MNPSAGPWPLGRFSARRRRVRGSSLKAAVRLVFGSWFVSRSVRNGELPLMLLAAASTVLHAQTDLRDALKDNVESHWIYDDFQQARARAKETGKPLLVLFRCVP